MYVCLLSSGFPTANVEVPNLEQLVLPSPETAQLRNITDELEKLAMYFAVKQGCGYIMKGLKELTMHERAQAAIEAQLTLYKKRDGERVAKILAQKGSVSAGRTWEHFVGPSLRDFNATCASAEQRA